MRLPPAVQQELARRRLVTTGRARAQGGAGERPSRAKGAGLEFADHRPYQPGDDIRALDAQVTARLGTPVVREYVVHQQLPVLVVLDASASMGTGSPRKFELAQQLAAALAYAGLSGGDSVQAVTFGEGVETCGRMQGVNRATELLGWLGRARPGGSVTLHQAVTHAAARAPRGALVILVGDFLGDLDPQALRHAHSRAQEVLAVQVLAPDELDPAPLGRGLTRLEDAEGEGSLSVVLDSATLDAYRRALGDWNAALAALLGRHGGRLVQVRSDQAVQQVILREFLARGVIR
ncbi:DUF58 domain-containing protein [Deinococcus koreensis]|uniref:DUF58 domain-containing protein n=1 Tax=Deinococcus koreensis TaxID=2054903 RepID=A0A2K3UUB2_9DEIO|nr:DUF58 domain-containing protein [Deinococcus koreensis]PNY80122.1 hypothetical protein CVO96_01015 [Deinococcus koreensis]